MSLKSYPCNDVWPDGKHHCPYCEGGVFVDCEWYCGADEPEDYPEDYYDEPEDIDSDCGFDPYLGCYTGDC